MDLDTEAPLEALAAKRAAEASPGTQHRRKKQKQAYVVDDDDDDGGEGGGLAARDDLSEDDDFEEVSCALCAAAAAAALWGSSTRPVTHRQQKKHTPLAPKGAASCEVGCRRGQAIPNLGPLTRAGGAVGRAGARHVACVVL